MRGVYGLFIVFDATVGLRGPNFRVVCLSLCMLVFKEKLCFELMECDIFVIDEYNYE